MKPGIYRNLSFQEYRAIEAINKSGLDLIAQSPAHYLASLDQESKQTPAMKLGSAIHCAVLEFEEFDKRYLTEPIDPPRRPSSAQINAKKPSPETIESINFWKDFEGRAAGRETISLEDQLICSNIRTNLYKKSAASEFLMVGFPEVTLVWEDQETGVLCKARCDWLSEHSGAIVDLKSTASAERFQFQRQVFSMNWHRQAAWYVDGYKNLTGQSALFVFAAVEKESPYESNFFYMGEQGLEVGRAENRRHVAAYARALSTQDWSGYPNDLVKLEPPAYLTNRQEVELF